MTEKGLKRLAIFVVLGLGVGLYSYSAHRKSEEERAAKEAKQALEAQARREQYQARDRLRPVLEKLKAHYAQHPFGGGWDFLFAELDGTKIRVVVNVPETTANAFIREKDTATRWATRSLTARIACPNDQEEIWSELESGDDIIVQPTSSFSEKNIFSDESCRFWQSRPRQ